MANFNGVYLFGNTLLSIVLLVLSYLLVLLSYIVSRAQWPLPATSKLTDMNTITITEDTALQTGVSIKWVVNVYLQHGYKIIHSYMHPAVGMVYTMQKWFINP